MLYINVLDAKEHQRDKHHDHHKETKHHENKHSHHISDRKAREDRCNNFFVVHLNFQKLTFFF